MTPKSLLLAVIMLAASMAHSACTNSECGDVPELVRMSLETLKNEYGGELTCDSGTSGLLIVDGNADRFQEVGHELKNRWRHSRTNSYTGNVALTDPSFPGVVIILEKGSYVVWAAER